LYASGSLAKNSDALIGVQVDLEFEGVKRIGSVGILARRAEGKTPERGL